MKARKARKKLKARKTRKKLKARKTRKKRKALKGQRHGVTQARKAREVRNLGRSKFSRIIEYYMRNIFHEKSCTKCNGETIPRAFSKISKLGISLDQ